jgi:hypothetical protein
MKLTALLTVSVSSVIAFNFKAEHSPSGVWDKRQLEDFSANESECYKLFPAMWKFELPEGMVSHFYSNDDCKDPFEKVTYESKYDISELEYELDTQFKSIKFISLKKLESESRRKRRNKRYSLKKVHS